MKRKFWLTLGALLLLLTSGPAFSESRDQGRKDNRKQIRQARKSPRPKARPRRSALERSRRQVQWARAAAVGAWPEANNSIARNALVLAGDLARTGDAQAAAELLQHVANTMPPRSRAGQILRRLCERAPRCRGVEVAVNDESQEFEESGLNVVVPSAALHAWLGRLDEACTTLTGDKPKPKPKRMKRKKPIGCNCAPAYGWFGPMTGGMAGLPAAGAETTPAKWCTPAAPGDIGTRPDGTPAMNIIACQIIHRENLEIQEVELVRYDDNGFPRRRHFQVTRTVNKYNQVVSRVERIQGVAGRFIHQVSNDSAGNFVQDSHDFVPCDE